MTDLNIQTDRHYAAVTLLTVNQVAELLNVHPRTVWQMKAAGSIPQPIRLSKQIVRWRLSDLEAHIQKLA